VHFINCHAVGRAEGEGDASGEVEIEMEVEVEVEVEVDQAAATAAEAQQVTHPKQLSGIPHDDALPWRNARRRHNLIHHEPMLMGLC
jgi:hypothetical protein